MTSEEQADARQRILMCITIAETIERSQFPVNISNASSNAVRAKQIGKQLEIVLKSLRVTEAGPNEAAIVCMACGHARPAAQ